ncbi:MAG: hypothetical protein Q4G22_15165 [Paracoccus sp. (in: a-proteobacteria)]|uniref:hypothetical protein n=1 Tax=Paracoccus sp. TaxID=267 RepID=UPI0026DF0405|nr:hypothetical protein [Paracoccus sp. (in: a-proteobacteria)]MDO5633153.1 hypothetical protein [Paracoccus sp. (in: a-proteobacteria)]
MNDMTHPDSAAQTSADIGDVLSAIRRLIAEDEVPGDVAAQDADAGAVGDGDLLAHRYGGNAALARRFAAPLNRCVEDALAASPAGPAHAPHQVEAEVMSDSSTAAPVFAVVGPATVEDAPDSTPLRLSEADRIAPNKTEGSKDTPVAAPRRSRWSRIGLPVNRRATAQIRAESMHETLPPETPAPETVASEPSAMFDAALSAAEALAADLDPVIADQGGDVEQAPPAVARPALSDLDLAFGNDTGDADQALREMIRDIVQQELHGELGQRFSRNLRAVIRREVLAAIEDNFDRN